MTTEPRSELQKLLQDRRAAILDELGKTNPDLVKELLQLDVHLAIAAAGAKESDEYVQVRSPIAAILDYLGKANHALPREQIAKDVEAKGYGRGQLDKPYWTLIDTIRYHLGERDKKNKRTTGVRIVERNGLIGKPDWPEDMFASRMVSVSNRLPEPGTLCIVFNGSYGVAWYKAINSVYEWTDEGEQWRDVTHWSLPPAIPRRR